MMGPNVGGRESGKMSTDKRTDTTLFALPFIWGVVLAVPCRVPQNCFLIVSSLFTPGRLIIPRVASLREEHPELLRREEWGCWPCVIWGFHQLILIRRRCRARQLIGS